MEQFESFGIIQPILKALKASGYSEPTPIQQRAIPPLLKGADLLGCAQTGTGKTAAFAVPVLQKLSAEPQKQGKRPIRALVLTPTRELAAQIDESFADYGRFLPLRHTAVFGGVGQGTQVKTLAGGIDILTATPGRLIDLIGQKFIDLSRVEIFVLDEADRMLDMGFLHDVERVIGLLPEKRQTMLFSATMPPEIEKLTHRILNNPEKIAVTPVASTVDSVEQQVYYVNKSNKTKLLLWILQDQSIYSALVFTRTKHGANKLADYLKAAGEACGVIHANKSQTARQQALADFKSGRLRVLAATDIVARGIDISELSLVVNYDIPEAPEDYVHRIGRTGRAGFGGRAVSLCDAPERASLRDIEKLINKKISVVEDHPYPFVEMPEPAAQQNGRGAPGPRRENFRRGGSPRPAGTQNANRPDNSSGRTRQRPAGTQNANRPDNPSGRTRQRPAGTQNANRPDNLSGRTRQRPSGTQNANRPDNPSGRTRQHPAGTQNANRPDNFSGRTRQRPEHFSSAPETEKIERPAENGKPREKGKNFFGRKLFGFAKKHRG